jgi:hypothetical protein
MRNWKSVARGYDSLVFNTALQGEYLPLSRTYVATTNYPGQTSFGLPSYVGGSLGNGEGINCIPAVVGASLAGIDKSNQGGVDWVRMCREWFNKANGQNVYLNSPGSVTGNDWWYETMPNVFFYQLYSMYPTTEDFAFQCTAVADRWLAAIHGMGGSTTPWSLANVQHRAFDLIGMLPNNNGVVEPEAAGAIAWILYQAYVKTGDQRYRIGAELALESLIVYTSNPSYELQLPYGTYIAARMNAELGTTYDVAKMLQWCFSNGNGTLRQWGVTVGNWGGYDCSGLIGEINYSNDYPFFMNTVEQAGALVPLVRYDDRYARAIGKWVLNAANASRLFYTDALPADNQDGFTWSQLHDPSSTIAHEAMRQFHPANGAISPYATGDAVKNGWAPTNYALYGASHAGIFAGIIDTTNVPMILRLDLVATDYFHRAAYPTYLYFNPYSSDTSVVLNVGGGSHDLYNTVSKTFLRMGVSGSTAVTIPANSAVVVVVAPSGGTVTYDIDRTLINGVVVDFRSARPEVNHPPRVKSLSPALDRIGIGTTVSLFCTAVDADGDSVRYAWSPSAGFLADHGAWAEWTAPSLPGEYVVQCTVSDGRGGASAAVDTVTVLLRTNIPPTIQRLNALPRKLQLGGTSSVMCAASDPDGDTLAYSWSSSFGSVSGAGNSITWSAPAIAGNYYVRCRVQDGFGGVATDSVGLEVRDLSIHQSGLLVARYPLDGNATDATGHGHDGVVNGAQLTNDRFGAANSAYAFDGATASIVVANDTGLNFQASMSVSLWMKVTGLTPGREQYPISHGNWQNRWKLSLSPVTNRLRFTVKNSSGQVRDLDGESSLASDSTYHVTCVYSGAELEIYVNGVLDAFTPFSGQMNATTSALTLGQNLPGDNNYSFHGVLDEVRIYNYALSMQEIAALLTTVAEGRNSPELPAGVFLDQNYPNPFNPATSVTFRIRNTEFITLKVYDLLGREVSTLVNGLKDPGTHTVVFDGSAFASGMYVYRLLVPGYVETRKMLLLH